MKVLRTLRTTNLILFILSFSTTYDGGGGFRGYGKGLHKRTKNKTRGQKFDLRKFLPGGEKDPKRRMASLSKRNAQQIGKKHIDIWQKITSRYQGICQVGRLRGCGRR